MGYVFPTACVDALKDCHHPDPVIRAEARRVAQTGLDGYEHYMESMRGGLFGLIIGKALFPPASRKKT